MFYNHGPEASNSTLGAQVEQSQLTTRPRVPVIVLGGSQNALSVARNLASNNIDVIAINYPYEAVRFSRYAQYVHLGDGCFAEACIKFLLGTESEHLRGSVLLACSDEAISIIVNNHDALSRKFLLEETSPAHRRDLLDKFTMYRLGKEAGVPTVGFWLVRSPEELQASLEDLRFPLIMKPLYSPHSRLLGSKAMLIFDRSTLIERYGVANRHGIGVVLMEYIPGGDDHLCAYYTYLDEHGHPLVHLTKRTPRRFPPESGDGTYHVTSWDPQAAALGLQFFRHINFRGLGNIEFKFDDRDGLLKLIEVNARLTAPDCLIARSGVNLPLIIYNRITGRPQPPVLNYKKSLVLCRPIEDTLAAWELYRKGQLRVGDWIRDLGQVSQLPFFEWRDPIPAFAVLGRRAWRLLSEFAAKQE